MGASSHKEVFGLFWARPPRGILVVHACDHDPSFLVDFIDKAAGDTSLISGAFNFALILPGLAVTVRRLHDVDRSGWWLLGFIVPIAALGTLGAAASMDSPSFDGMTASIVILGLVLVILGIVLLIFTIKPGTQGSNDYGPDPYGPHGLEEVLA